MLLQGDVETSNQLIPYYVVMAGATILRVLLQLFFRFKIVK